MIPWSLIFYISEWIIRLTMLVLVTQRKKPASAMAWLLIIFFYPWAGLFIYLLIGEYSLPRQRVKRYTRLYERLKKLRTNISSRSFVVRPDIGPEFAAAVNLAEKLGYMPIVNGNHAVLLSNTHDVLQNLVSDIDCAKNHIHMLFYIFANDQTGQTVADALIRAQKRGVQCRILTDAVGSGKLINGLDEKMRQNGIEYHELLPVGLFRRTFSRMDLRNHRKLAVIDGKIAYTGSQNIINASYGRKDMIWHDLMVRLTGPAVLELQAVFISDWYYQTKQVLESDNIFPEPEFTGNIPIQTLPSGPNYPTENYQRMTVAAIHSAHKHIIITTPYFVPDEPFQQALETAVMRDVKVQLIVPYKSNLPLVSAASHSYFERLLEMGVEIYLFKNGLLHTKAMSIDDTIAFIGSGNFDIRSFTLNFEINLLCYGAETTELLRKQQNLYIQNSIPLNLNEWNRRPKLKKIGQNIAKLLSPLL